jgi:hypothetical protein
MRPCLKKTHHKNRAGGVAQDEGPEFKPQYHKKKKKKITVFARHQWLTPVILATQEAEIRSILV